MVGIGIWIGGVTVTCTEPVPFSWTIAVTLWPPCSAEPASTSAPSPGSRSAWGSYSRVNPTEATSAPAVVSGTGRQIRDSRIPVASPQPAMLSVGSCADATAAERPSSATAASMRRTTGGREECGALTVALLAPFLFFFSCGGIRPGPFVPDT
jgi:hypothetical protein